MQSCWALVHAQVKLGVHFLLWISIVVNFFIWCQMWHWLDFNIIWCAQKWLCVHLDNVEFLAHLPWEKSLFCILGNQPTHVCSTVLISLWILDKNICIDVTSSVHLSFVEKNWRFGNLCLFHSKLESNVQWQNVDICTSVGQYLHSCWGSLESWQNHFLHVKRFHRSMWCWQAWIHLWEYASHNIDRTITLTYFAHDQICTWVFLNLLHIIGLAIFGEVDIWWPAYRWPMTFLPTSTAISIGCRAVFLVMLLFAAPWAAIPGGCDWGWCSALKVSSSLTLWLRSSTMISLLALMWLILLASTLWFVSWCCVNLWLCAGWNNLTILHFDKLLDFCNI